MNKAERLLTRVKLKQIMHYDPLTGIWARSHSVWSRAGCRYSHGYRYVWVDGHRYAEHRLAFKYMENRWPTEMVDHKNQIRDDNRWSNLREATNSQNLGNQGVTRRSLTGLKWVTVSKIKGCTYYQSVIWKDNKKYYLGNYKTPLEAHLVAAAKSKELYGEFARAA